MVNGWPYGGYRQVTMPDLDDLKSVYLAPFMEHCQVLTILRRVDGPRMLSTGHSHSLPLLDGSAVNPRDSTS